MWSTAKRIWLDGPMVGLKKPVWTPEQRLRFTQSAMAINLFVALSAIEIDTARYHLWAIDRVTDVLFVLWMLWWPIKRIARA